MVPAHPSTSAPVAPAAPGGGAGLQRSYIWSGVIEWMGKGQSPGDQQTTIKHLPCQVSAISKDIEPELKVDTWPNKLLMQLMPKKVVSSMGGQYLKDSKSVLFHLQPSKALDELTKVMVNGFAGCVHFSQCHIKVLFLLYTPDKKAYLGFIPRNQNNFIDRLREVIETQKVYLMINKRMPAVSGSSGMLPNMPQSTMAGSSGMTAGSLGGVSQMGQPQIESQQHQMAVKRKSCVLEALVEWQVDNPKDREILERIKNLAAIYLPEGWKEWKVVVHTREDLLGEDLDPKILNKIRFCLPTVDLARAFSPDTTSLSEKVYKDIKLKMLEWPFCVGLIIDPPFVAAKIRGSAIHNELVNASLADLKPLLLSRKDASKELEDNVDDDVSTVSSSSSESEKMSRMDKLEKEFSDMKTMLSNFMSRFEPTSDNVSEQESSPSDNETLPKQPPSSHTLVNAEKHSKAPSPALVEDNEDFDFSPQTREQEPTITTPKPHIEKQGVQCLRLGELAYKQIRYTDVQKKLQAFPVFHALKLNPALQKIRSPDASFEALAKQEAFFGTILHGLLLQQEALTNVVKDLSATNPSLKQVLKESLCGPDSAFKCVSDDVLQYVCGRKVEAIELRRRASLPQDDNVSSLLNNIPPSSTHLFDEIQVSELVKQPSVQGFFRGSTAIYKPKFHYQPKLGSTYEQRKHNKQRKRPRSQQDKASSAFDSRKPNKRVPKRPFNTRSKEKFRKPESKKPRRS